MKNSILFKKLGTSPFSVAVITESDTGKLIGKIIVHKDLRGTVTVGLWQSVDESQKSYQEARIESGKAGKLQTKNKLANALGRMTFPRIGQIPEGFYHRAFQESGFDITWIL